MKVSKSLANAYASRFLGYGNPRSHWWFIGLQEGIGRYEEFNRRLLHWSRRGRRQLEDLTAFHEAFCTPDEFHRLFGPPGTARPQWTWRGLIRVYLSATGHRASEITTEVITGFQTRSLASIATLIELHPFPAKRLADLDGELSGLFSPGEVRARRLVWLKERKAVIAEMIQIYRPRNVIFYGVSALKNWREITGASDLSSERVYRPNKWQRFIVMRHPAAHGLSSSYQIDIGNALRRA